MAENGACSDATAALVLCYCHVAHFGGCVSVQKLVEDAEA